MMMIMTNVFWCCYNRYVLGTVTDQRIQLDMDLYMDIHACCAAQWSLVIGGHMTV